MDFSSRAESIYGSMDVIIFINEFGWTWDNNVKLFICVTPDSDIIKDAK